MANRAIKRRQEVKSDRLRVLREEWDAANWNTYIINGRILPERCMVECINISSKVVSGSIRSTVRLDIINSHLSGVCNTDTEISSFQLSNIVKQAVYLPTDYIAFVNRAFYEIVLDTWRHAETGETGTFPVYEPFLEPAPDGYLFKPGTIEFDIPWTHTNDSLTTALHDLGQALRYPRRTLEYCRMALEAVRFHFDPSEEKNWRKRWTKGEKAMCAALRIDIKQYRKLERDAAPGRHGEPLSDLNWPRRCAALQLGWEVVYRFRLYLDGVSVEDWKIV